MSDFRGNEPVPENPVPNTPEDIPEENERKDNNAVQS